MLSVAISLLIKKISTPSFETLLSTTTESFIIIIVLWINLYYFANILVSDIQGKSVVYLDLTISLQVTVYGSNFITD